MLRGDCWTENTVTTLQMSSTGPRLEQRSRVLCKDPCIGCFAQTFARVKLKDDALSS